MKFGLGYFSFDWSNNLKRRFTNVSLVGLSKRKLEYILRDKLICEKKKLVISESNISKGD